MGYKTLATTALLSVASVGSYLLLKNKVNVSSGDAVETVKDSAEVIEKVTKTFAGVTEEELDNLAKSTARGVKAVIEGDTLRYVYRSASGKTKNIAEFNQNESGEIIGSLFSYVSAKSPRQFGDAFYKLIKSKSQS